MPATTDTPHVLRTLPDGRFAVAVTNRGEDGTLALTVQQHDGLMAVTSLSVADLRALLALAESDA